jgi:hypothetical protein
MCQNTPEQFTAQLREGQYNELRVALYFMLQGYHVKIGFKNQSYDISVLFPDTSAQSVEVKWDKTSAKTGNLFFEIENTRQQRPSGIEQTGADLWCHVIGDGRSAIIAPVTLIRNILNGGNYRVVSTRGADSNSRGKLVPISDMQNRQGIDLIELPTVEDFFGMLFRKANSAA